jgi:hypothetical protein
MTVTIHTNPYQGPDIRCAGAFNEDVGHRLQGVDTTLTIGFFWATNVPVTQLSSAVKPPFVEQPSKESNFGG